MGRLDFLYRMDLPHRAKSVYIYLADRANKDGECWPAIPRTALAINEKWRVSGVGEIRMTRAFKYHGKLYLFLKDNLPKSAILGSAMRSCMNAIRRKRSNTMILLSRGLCTAPMRRWKNTSSFVQLIPYWI